MHANVYISFFIVFYVSLVRPQILEDPQAAAGYRSIKFIITVNMPPMPHFLFFTIVLYILKVKRWGNIVFPSHNITRIF